MAMASRCIASSTASASAAGEHKAPVIPAPPKRVSLANLAKFKKTNRPIVMVTAYDYPSAVQADLAGVDLILVGDSVGVWIVWVGASVGVGKKGGEGGVCRYG